ncbi:MAG: GNAT family N-acetyltransferase [Gammaproteobacteria bacterium]|nr:GNAT family N-acetyltransferase [Gammaproteobacteria bacterium]
MVDYVFTAFANLESSMLYDIMALREEVFTFEQKCTERDLDGLDKEAIHIYAVENDGLFAVARILPPGVYRPNIVSFGRLAIKQSYRSKGYGKAIMCHVIQYIDRHYPDIPIEFSAQLYLQHFYEELGFKAIGDVYEEAGIAHISMVKQSVEE